MTSVAHFRGGGATHVFAKDMSLAILKPEHQNNQNNQTYTI